MDFRTADRKRARRNRRLLYAGGGVAGAAILTALLARIAPAAPEVRRSSIWTGVVEYGELVRQVRGPGTLVVPPEDLRWIAAETRGRVEERGVLPGAPVAADTVLLVLSNPELAQEAREADLEYRAQQAELEELRLTTRSELLSQENAAERVAADFAQASRRAEADLRLREDGLIGELILRRSQVRADELETRHALEQERLDILEGAGEAQLRSKEATVARYRAARDLKQHQVEALTVRAGQDGILLEIPVEVGQEVAPGANLARVADPQRLRATLRVAETQARDVAPGQPVSVDTRNGVVAGVVERVDPSVREGRVAVDVRLSGALPRGARPDLSVDGVIELDRLAEVLHVGRPAYGQPGSLVGLFRLSPEGDEAVRVPVRLGRSSVNRIEVVSGLERGEEIVLSDTAAWDQWDRIRLR